MTGLSLWAGKILTPEEDARVRSLAAMLRRNDQPNTADHFERFLLENLHLWTEDDLRARVSLSFSASTEEET